MSSKKENLKVTFLIGIPGSGKSTWAKNHVKYNENTTRVNRDDMREMLKTQQVCEPKIEDLVTDVLNETILKALLKKQNVIIDNTNLKARYMNDIIKIVETHADVEFRIFDMPVEVCIERDAARDKKVGEAVIKKMYKDYLNLLDTFDFKTRFKLGERPSVVPNFKSELPDAVIFDIDGNLTCSMNGRSPFEWHKVDRDSPNHIVIEQVAFHKSKGRRIIVCSGRDACCRALTIEWLNFYGIEFDELHMRPENDYRKDSLIKKEIYLTNIKDKYNVLCVYDDRIQVVMEWHKLGLFVFTTNQGLLVF